MFAQIIETNLRRLIGAGVISLTLLIGTGSEDLSSRPNELHKSYAERGFAETFSSTDTIIEAASSQSFRDSFKRHFDGNLREAFSHKLLEISLAKEPFLR